MPVIRSLVAAVALAVAGCAPEAAEAPARSAMYERLGRDVGDVTLVGADGKPVQWDDLGGRPRAVFFGFTHCPEICPTTVADLAGAIARAGPAAAAIRVDFITVDPARDTPDRVGAYLSSFGPQFRGFSGDPAEIARLAKAFRAAYARVDLEGGDYTMDHTTSVYLIDADGMVVDLLPYQSSPAAVDAKLRGLLGG